MCGRLVLTSNYKEKINAIFAGLESGEWLPPRYNITPAQRIPAILDVAPGKLHWIHWGFPPTQAGRAPLINARSETADQLPTFRDAFMARRCVILADGFYEWKRGGHAAPQPYFFQRADEQVFALAGLWQEATPPAAVLLTTEANRLMSPIHDRMPVLLSPDAVNIWLSHATPRETLRAMLQPAASALLKCHPVSSRVNRATQDGPELIEHVMIYEQGTLL